jgi:membrane-associated protease RseP (regulator of RpoE activity)
MEFIYYDLSFLVLFSLIVGLFLYKNRKKLQIENKILLLYRTSFGLNFIEKMSKKSPWIFRTLAVLSIASGFILMIIAIYMLLETIRLIWTSVVVIKVPPLMPLVPYLPSLFKIEFLPPFYFTYWIIAIAIVAICHEFMHGVFARFYNVKLKSTGFGFLGPFLAAFVELDEKKLEKKPVKSQMAVLSGGSFANLIISILFLILMNGFFAATFVQAGVTVPQLNVDGIIIPSYILAAANTTSLAYNGNPINLTSLSLENKTEFKLDGKNGSYYMTKDILSITPKNSSILIVYMDSPAYRLKINGTIQKINDKKIKNFSDFKNAMSPLKPYENISLETSEKNYTLELIADPNNSSRAVIGIGFPEEEQKSGAFASLVKKFVTKKDAFTNYAPISALSIFVYNLLLWIVLINVSVMFVNMLPFSIFDGGRFFYLFLFSLTKSKKKAMKGFKIANMLILLILIALMAVWFFRTI